MTITLGSSCDSPGMSAMPGAFIFARRFHAKGAKTAKRENGFLCGLAPLRETGS
jgi:hypothetical protein